MPTLTVKQTGGDHSTLNSALVAAAPGDTISIEGTWTIDDTTAASIVDDNLTIQTSSGSKHPGHWDESLNHYRLVVSDGSHALTLSGAYTVTVDGLAIEQAGTGDSDEVFRVEPDASDTATIRNCLLQCSTNTDAQDCVYTGFNKTIGVVTVENCMIWGAARAGVDPQNYQSANHDGTININSCTIWLCGRDPSPDSIGTLGGGIISYVATGAGNGAGFTINVHNTICVENDTGGSVGGDDPADYRELVNGGGTGLGAFNVSFSIDSDASIASDTDGGTGNLASRTATDNTSPGGGDWVIFEDITSAPYDLRIVDNDEDDAQNMHSTATAHGLTIPSTDIVGTSRPQNVNYDCGAFELSVGEYISPFPPFRRV